MYFFFSDRCGGRRGKKLCWLREKRGREDGCGQGGKRNLKRERAGF